MSKPSSIVAAALALLLSLIATVAFTAPAEAEGHHRATYYVTITNDTEGQYLTPPNWVVHANQTHVFRLGLPASPGLMSVAENGGVGDLEAELVAHFDAVGLGDSGVALPADPAAPPVIAPGSSRSFIIESDQDRLSIVAMLVCTNDGFAGLDAKSLPSSVGQSKQYRLQAHDAGTELNTEADADLVPAPFCASPAVGSGMSNPALAEHGVVRHHRGITGVGDLDASYDWSGPAATVTVERLA